MKSYFIILFLLFHINSFSSSRVTVKKEFENIILFYDGNTNDEEFAKLEFIAKRILQLSKEYNYSKRIILNYLFSDDTKKKQYYLAYSKPIYYYKHKEFDEIELIKLLNEEDNFIILTSYDEIKSQTEALKLIDFALSNLNKFKKLEVEKIEYDRFEYEYNYVYSISPKSIQKIIDNNVISKKINSVLSQKIYREIDNKENTYFISYFTKNDNYFPYLRERDKETILDTLKQIKYFARQSNNVFIFKDKYKFNLYAFPTLGNSVIIKKEITYNDNKNFVCTFITINEILTGVYLIEYQNEKLETTESSLFTIEKGMIETKLSKYEHYPEIR